LSGREGFGVLSPSRRVCEKIKCLFSIAPDARTRGEVTEQVYIEKHMTDAHDACDRCGYATSVA
jgi:hypothetical protein